MSRPAEIQPSYRYTLPPGLTSHVRVKTLPNASCTLRTEADGPSPVLLVYSDADGFVNLHVRPSGEHQEYARLSIEADAGSALALNTVIVLVAFATMSMFYELLYQRLFWLLLGVLLLNAPPAKR